MNALPQRINLIANLLLTCIRQIAKSPNRQIAKSPNRQITKSPNRQIAKSPNRPIIILLLLLPSSLFADKLDSLLHIHDTATIVYYNFRTDSLAIGRTYTVQGDRITGFQRYNPLDQRGRFSASSSNIGLAYKNLVFEPQLADGFYTGMQSFDAYTFTNENTRYFRHLIPVTYLAYFNGPEKEQDFRVIHSHTIKRTVTIGIDFNIINSPGQYNNQKSDDKSFVVTGQYYTKDLRFGVLANYRVNKFLVLENGGIANDSDFEDKLESDTRLYDVNLTTAQNLVREKGAFTNAYFYLSGKPEIIDSTKMRPPTFHAGRIDYTFNYTQQTQVYSDEDPLVEFYAPFGPILDSNETYDSLRINSFENRFSWSNLRMGDTPEKKYLLVIFAINSKRSTISDSISESKFKNWIPEASMIIRPYRLMDIHLSGKYTFGTFNTSGFELNGTLNQRYNTKKGQNGNLSFGFTTSSQQAGYFLTNFHSNYFRWDTSFSNQIIQQADFSLRFQNLVGKVEYQFISDYVYLNQEARPAQYKGSINLIRFDISDEFRWKTWGFDARIVYTMNSNKDIIRTPDFMARLSLYPTLSLFKNAAVLQPGVDILYNTGYYASAYMPALRMFYLQDEKKIGSYPYIDVFVSLMVKRFRIFVKYQHINDLWRPNDYYMVPHYPAMGAAFKWGLSWSFYD
jgi:hypothetical protein